MRRHPLLGSLILLPALVFAACNGVSLGRDTGGASGVTGVGGATTTTSSSTTASSGSTTASSGSTTASGSSSGGIGSQCSSGAGGGPPYAGDAGVLLLQAFGGPSGEVAAQVPLLEPGVGPETTCSASQDAGACHLTVCQIGGIGSPGPGWGDFGPMVASVGSTTVPVTYNGTGYPTVYFPSSVTLGTGGTMKFQGGGSSGVPPFDVCITIPGLAVITSPVPTTDGGTVVVDTAHDLPITWEPFAIGQFQFQLVQSTGPVNSQQVSIACAFDGASGAGVIPQALLPPLKEMSGTASTYATVRSELPGTLVVNGLTITTQGYQQSRSVLGSFNVAVQ